MINNIFRLIGFKLQIEEITFCSIETLLLDEIDQCLIINFIQSSFVNNHLNKNIEMSQQQKFPMAPNPFRYPIPYPPINPDKLKLSQTNLPPTPLPNASTLPNNMQPGAYMHPRMFNSCFGGYGMFSPPPPFPHYGSYFPMMPPPHMSSMLPSNSKGTNILNENQKRQMNPPPFMNRMQNPFVNPLMFYPRLPAQLRPPTIDQQGVKKLTKNITIEEKTTQKPPIKEIRSLHSSDSQTPLIKQESKKAKIKQTKHADANQYEPLPPKKKVKKEEPIILDRPQRQTRQKKQSIQKLMVLVMKQKPLRDRVIKIGKQYQAVIPQSFINEYEYNLKIKLQKKKNLMNRLITIPS